MTTKNTLKDIMIAFLLISLGGFIVNGIIAIRDALINSGILQGSIQSYTYETKTISQEDIIKTYGLKNTSNRMVIIKDLGDKYLVSVYTKKPIPLLASDYSNTIQRRTIDAWVLTEQFTVEKQYTVKTYSNTVNYDFTVFVKILSVIIAISLLFVVAEKLGIRL